MSKLMILATLAAAPVPSDPDVADARCLATFAYIVGQEASRSAPTSDALPTGFATTAVMYFTGKLFGRSPSADVAALIRHVSPSITAAPRRDLQRCAAELQRVGGVLQAAGRNDSTR